ncbi:hypothetical protein FA10DRAFT_297988 [Acaromyces ingoldii]|uniref:Uncharacterized protein n=1 Tax=Acaromyces ingoldii TaxID=215250 RepID=A0A316YBL3_9BASI|nr:hypothetical protein FA10DRAFT_297988 [Acaromyces ingoldii]PWN86927.1 hypothetical protein FA10DRAFT_297988 [Acaromyces ingoldii]
MVRPSLFALLVVLSLALSTVARNAPRAHKKVSSAASKPKYNANPNPTDTFCKSFISQCYKTSLSGKKGKVHVVHSCHRNGGKYSPSYSFGCKANGVDKTKAVLNKIGGGYTVTVTQGSTVVVTGTVTDYSTSTQSLTSEVDVTTTLDVTSSDTATVTNTATETDTETTTLTTAIPITYTSETTATVTTTSTSTDTVTSTTTQVLVGVDPVPIVEVAISPAVAKRINKVAKSSFCSAFSTGCTSQCKRVSSTPKHVVCQAKDSLHYQLTCYCKNRKVETQHALAAAMNQEHIATVSTVATSTTYATVTATTVVPTTVLSTSVHTLTSTIPVTSTYTTSTTVTSTVTDTASTGTPMTVSTTVSTGTATVTASATTTSTATSTTQIVLAATGAVHAFSAADDSDQGYLKSLSQYPGSDTFYYTTTDRTAATTFMAVQDPASGLFQLQTTDGSGNVLIAEAGFSAATFASGSAAYTWTYPGAPSLCGAAGSQGAPAAGAGSYDGNTCETYVFGPQADAETLAQGATVVLQSDWYNPSATSPGQYYWVLDSSVQGLYGVADPSAFYNQYHESYTQVNLRFPA